MTSQVLQPHLPTLARVRFGTIDLRSVGSLLPLAAVALILIAMMPATIVAMAADLRTFQGDSIWLKPFKFQLALAVFFGTVAYFGLFTSAAFRTSRAVYWFACAAGFCALAEIAWIGGAAFFGTASHFNVGSEMMATIYSTMGAFAVILTASALVVGIAVLRHRDSGLSQPMRLAIGGSLILTFFATVITAGYMSAAPGHLVGPEAQRAAHWLTGWSTQVGDLRVPHFFATHAVHFVPALMLAFIWLRPKQRSVWPALVLLAAYTGFTAFTFMQAVNGQPFMTI